MMHCSRQAMSVLRQPFVSLSASISAARLGNRHFTDDASASANHPAKPSRPGQTTEKECQTSQRASTTTTSADNQQPRYERLIRKRYTDLVKACSDPDLLGDNVPESVWYLKLYGPHIKVITDIGVPSGWILVDRNTPMPLPLSFSPPLPCLPISNWQG